MKNVTIASTSQGRRTIQANQKISTLTIELQHVNDKKYYFNSCKQTYPEDLYVHLVVSQMIECVLGAVT